MLFSEDLKLLHALLNGMTICIAAIGKDENGKELIVFATDHMISLQQIGQFEMTVEKYKKITDNTVAMLSGEPLIFDDLIEPCKNNCSFEEMKDKIQKKMNDIKNERVQKQILDTYMMNYDNLKELLKNPLQNPYALSMFDAVSKFTLNTVILLIGFKEDEAQITEITETRIAAVRDLSFDAIGTGGLQAINTMLFQRHSKVDSLSTTIYNVYKAKRNAEVAVGVGKEIDMMVLFKTGVVKIGEDVIGVLSEVYDEELKYGKSHKKLLEIMKSIKVR
jgi:hypothetical protein